MSNQDEKDQLFTTTSPDGVKSYSRGHNRAREIDPESFAVFVLANAKFHCLLFGLTILIRWGMFGGTETSRDVTAAIVGMIAFKHVTRHTKPLTNFPLSQLLYSLTRPTVFIPFHAFFVVSVLFYIKPPFFTGWISVIVSCLAFILIVSLSIAAFRLFIYNNTYHQKIFGDAFFRKTMPRMSEISHLSRNSSHAQGLMWKKYCLNISFFSSYVFGIEFLPLLLYSIASLVATSSTAVRIPFVSVLSGDFSTSWNLMRRIKLVLGALPMAHMLFPKNDAELAKMKLGLNMDWYRSLEPNRTHPELDHLSWERSVIDMMEYSKILVFDCRTKSEAFFEEIKLFSQCKFTGDVLFIGNSDEVASTLSSVGVQFSAYSEYSEETAANKIHEIIISKYGVVSEKDDLLVRRNLASLWDRFDQVSSPGKRE